MEFLANINFCGTGCKKKTYSTSPDEEEKDFETRPEDGASEDEDYYDEETRSLIQTMKRFVKEPEKWLQTLISIVYIGDFR